MENTRRLIGPFAQVLSLRNLNLRGSLNDEALEIIPNGGIVVEDSKILEIGFFESLYKKYNSKSLILELIEEDQILMPGFIDAHTHICFDGTRAMDFVSRNGGKSYLDIAKAGGGIWSTVKHTRNATQAQLEKLTISRLDKQLKNGITTVEIKSGYGLNVKEELKMLRAIKNAGENHLADVIGTCLAAHIIPKDGNGDEKEYLDLILNELVPKIQEEALCKRFDAFVEDSAFSTEGSLPYLNQLRHLGFDLTVHGDQFSTGGSKVAVDCKAKSVDHLEASGEKEIQMLAKSDIIPVALPGASIGIGCPFTPARKLLDAGCALAIASDWNPGSAPQGYLLSQASILSCFEKLSAAEVYSGITFRAAAALGLGDRGILDVGKKADFISFPCKDHREILYHQGEMKVQNVWKNGLII